MEIAKVEVSTIYAKTLYREEIPRGIAGAKVTFTFTDPIWENLDKMVIFQGACIRDAVLCDGMAVIPQEVVAAVNVPLRVGVYGCDAQKGVVIPTLWAELGTVKSAAAPSGQPGAAAEFAPWVRLREDVGDPKDLQTKTRENLVAAINELKSGGTGGALAALADPWAYGLPVLELNGDTTGMNKDNAVALDYVYGERSGKCTVKWQGSSSLAYSKKNYTIKFDEDFEAVPGWGSQKKYCLKANYIDHSHARNLVCAKLWGQIVRSRNYAPIPRNQFDLSQVTGLVTTWEGGVSVENGVLTNGVSMGQSGYVCFTGISFEPGTYTIRFEVSAVAEDVWGELHCGFMKQEHAGEVYTEKKFSLHEMYADHGVNTWYGMEVSGVELAQTAGFYLQADANPTSYRFRNIEVINTETGEANSLGRLFELPNGGAVDGFPCIIMLNGAFHGLYTFNIPKDGWMMGMNGSEPYQAILCADTQNNTCAFKALATLEDDFDLEYVTDEDNAGWVLTSLNTLISAVMDSDGTDLDTTVAQYLDWDSAIDYLIFTTLAGGADMVRKNYLLATFDGVKWFFSAYDMDSTYGMQWNGKGFDSSKTYPLLGDYNHRVMELITQYKKDALAQRYETLRNTILSEDNIYLEFSNFAAGIPAPLLVEDVKRWPTIPSSAASNTAQILNWYRMRSVFLDGIAKSLLA